MLQGFFDDSGSEPTASHFVLAGFVASADQWNCFSVCWQNKLDQSPSIDYFKMSEAMTFNGQFQGWPEGLRSQKVFELAEIIVAHIAARADVAIRWDHFQHFIKGHYGGPEFESPYFLLFYHLILTVNSYHQRVGLPNIELDYIFDVQGKVGANAAAWWAMVKSTIDPDRSALLGAPPIFGSDRRFLPLQAADMYAWLMQDRLVPKLGRHFICGAIIRILLNKFPIRKHLTKNDLMVLGARLLVAKARAAGKL